MNLSQPLKYHYYTYRRFYLIYLLLFISSIFLIPFLFSELTNFYYYYSIAMILVTFMFTIINSIYEFTIFINHYFKLKNIKSEFSISCFIYSILNSFIQTLLILATFLVSYYLYNANLQETFNYTNPFIYTLTFLIHFCGFAIIGIISLFIKNVKVVQMVLYLIVLFIVALISFDIIDSLIGAIYNLYQDPNLLIKVQPIFIIFSIIFYLLINYRIKRMYE